MRRIFGRERAGEPLDAIDERLLAALVADARISNKQLAELVGIAPSTALMRTRALSERGIIQGFEAKLSLSAIGRSVQALIAVRLRAHDREQIDRFTARVPKLPGGALDLPHVGFGGLPAAHRGRHHRGPARLGAGQPGHRPRGGPHRNHAGLRPHPGQPRPAAGLAWRLDPLPSDRRAQLAARRQTRWRSAARSVTAASVSAATAHSMTKPATAACSPTIPAASPSPITGMALPRYVMT